MLVLPVHKDFWHRGGDTGNNRGFLVDPIDKKPDILAIAISYAMGYSPHELTGYRFPSTYAQAALGRRRLFPYPLDWLVNEAHADSEDTLKVIQVNDDPSLLDEERENILKAIFRKHEIVLDFKNSILEEKTKTKRSIESMYTEIRDAWPSINFGDREENDDEDEG